MVKRLVCAAAVCACAGVALGAAVKISNWDIDTDSTPGPDDAATAIFGAHEPAGATAMGILNYARGADKTIVQLIVSDFTPDAGYFVTLYDGISDTTVGAFSTRQNGNGNFHTSVPGDLSGLDIRLFNQNFGFGINPPDNDPNTGTNLTATGIN